MYVIPAFIGTMVLIPIKYFTVPFVEPDVAKSMLWNAGIIATIINIIINPYILHSLSKAGSSQKIDTNKINIKDLYVISNSKK